jgi:hypothetical protein
MQATGETHRRVASPGVPGIQRNIAITPCFSKTKPQKIIRRLRVNQIWCEIRALCLDK